MENINLCEHCSQPNSNYDEYCVRCGCPLDHERIDLYDPEIWN